MSLTKVTNSMIAGAPGNIVNYGAVGDGITGCSSAINSALADYDSVIVYGGDFLIDSNLTVASGKSLIILNGGKLKIATGVTLTISGTIEAGDYEIFTLVGTGKVTFNIATTVYAGWWDSWSSDAGIAWSAAVASLPLNKRGSIRLPGEGTIKTTVNMTQLQSGARKQFEVIGASNGTTLNVEGSIIAVDCTGSEHLSFSNFRLRGSESSPPTIAFYLARDLDYGYSFQHRFSNVLIDGNWSKACVYSYASEENLFHDCKFITTGTGSCLWITGDNDGTGEDVVSPYVDVVTGAWSNTANVYRDTAFVTYGSAPLVKIRGASDHTFDGCYYQHSSTTDYSVYIDGFGTSSNRLYFSNSRFEQGSGTKPLYNIYADCSSISYISGITLRNIVSNAYTAFFGSASLMIVQYMNLSGITYNPVVGNKIVSSAQLKFSDLSIPYGTITSGNFEGGRLFCNASGFSGGYPDSSITDNRSGITYVDNAVIP